MERRVDYVEVGKKRKRKVSGVVLTPWNDRYQTSRKNGLNFFSLLFVSDIKKSLVPIFISVYLHIVPKTILVF